MDVSFAFGMRAKKFEPKFLPWFVLNDCIQNEEGGGRHSGQLCKKCAT